MHRKVFKVRSRTIEKVSRSDLNLPKLSQKKVQQ